MKVALRADATRHSGVGHVMRCLALADALRRQGAQTVFVARHLVGQLAQLITEHGHGLMRLPVADADARLLPEIDAADPAGWLGVEWQHDAAATQAVLAGMGGVDWLVVDHYALDARWQHVLRAQASKMLAIDDLANRPQEVDLLLDQNLYTNAKQRYRSRVGPDCRLLLGPRYALLRPRFDVLHRTAPVRSGPMRRLLVLMGGTDAANLTTTVLDAIDRLALPALEVDVVIGSAHPAREALSQRCANRPDRRLYIDTAQVAELMAAADLAIGAGGTATWERCAVGLPTLALCAADNQRELLQHAGAQGLLLAPAFDSFTADAIALHLRALIDNPALRELLSRQALAAVDGRGATRVAQAMYLASLWLQWREATLDDADALLVWRNHPSIRAVSHSIAAIAPAEHHAWLASVLADPNRYLLIGLRGDEPIGVVRFDLREDAAHVSIYRVPERPERGLGKVLLGSAELWLRERRPEVRTLVAEVLAGNEVSCRLFEGAGYVVHALQYHKTIPS